jgi:hypothetical protein
LPVQKIWRLISREEKQDAPEEKQYPSLQKLDILEFVFSHNTKMKMVRDWDFKVRGDIGKK